MHLGLVVVVVAAAVFLVFFRVHVVDGGHPKPNSVPQLARSRHESHPIY